MADLRKGSFFCKMPENKATAKAMSTVLDGKKEACLCRAVLLFSPALLWGATRATVQVHQ